MPTSIMYECVHTKVLSLIMFEYFKSKMDFNDRL